VAGTEPGRADLISPDRQLSVSVPVVVVLEKREVVGKHWTQNVWDLNSVLVGEHLAANQDAAISHSSSDSASSSTQGDHPERERSVWPGFQITLYRDACERYWHALIGDKPLVYVVLMEDETDGSVEPALVTLDYDEALAYSETDATVLSTEIPPALYQMMEKFVLRNYQPKAFKKRKRRNWSEESERSGGVDTRADHAQAESARSDKEGTQ